MPGTSVREAVATVVAAMTSADGLPHLPELPARGPGADLVGRTAGLLAAVAPDLAVETTPAGWRFADAPGRESRRARSWLGEDLDAWEEGLEGYARHSSASRSPARGPWLPRSSCAPASARSATRGRAATSPRRSQHAAVEHVADVRRRLPSARVSLWLDEPALPAVLQGEIATQSGLGRYAAVDEPVVEAALRRVVDAAARRGRAGRRALLRRSPAVRAVPPVGVRRRLRRPAAARPARRRRDRRAARDRAPAGRRGAARHGRRAVGRAR